MHPESHQVREVFDVGLIEDGWAGYTDPIRLIVVRTPHNPKRAHRIGKRIGDFIAAVGWLCPSSSSGAANPLDAAPSPG